MRVITGSARGRKLRTLDGLDVRPTTAVVKEAMFSSIQFEVEGARALDLFAGSGQLGIEALSRGAEFCVFVDSARLSREVVLENLQATGLMKRARVAGMDALSFLGTSGDLFDIALLDPPYGQGILPQVLPLLARRMTDGGVILCESRREEVLPGEAGDFAVHKTYHYGKIKLTAYRRKEPRP